MAGELEALIVDRLMGETMTELAQELQGSSSRPGVEHLAERIRIGAGTSFRVLRRHPRLLDCSYCSDLSARWHCSGRRLGSTDDP